MQVPLLIPAARVHAVPPAPVGHVRVFDGSAWCFGRSEGKRNNTTSARSAHTSLACNTRLSVQSRPPPHKPTPTSRRSRFSYVRPRACTHRFAVGCGHATKTQKGQTARIVRNVTMQRPLGVFACSDGSTDVQTQSDTEYIAKTIGIPSPHFHKPGSHLRLYSDPMVTHWLARGSRAGTTSRPAFVLRRVVLLGPVNCL